MIKMPAMTPYKPRTPAKIKMGKRSIRYAVPRLYRGMANEEMPVVATIITTVADTMPACTAACPMTSAPTILTAEPIGFGRRIPASRRPSNITSINRVSITVGNGTPSLAAAMLMSKFVGISC